MRNKYYRYTCKDGTGIYQAVKNKIFDSEISFADAKKKWMKFKNDDRITWLNSPNEYPKNLNSWFTEEGNSIFLKVAMPLIRKFISIEDIRKETTHDPGKIVYSDKHQVFVEC